jgi:ATP-dependent helicase/nuclease subunit B
LLPEGLLTLEEDSVATPLDTQLAWAELLREVALEEFRHVFPVDPPTRDVAWGLRLGKEFIRLQRALAEVGLTLADVRRRLGPGFVEAERWTEIAELERRLNAKLSRVGRSVATQARIALAAAPSVPAGVSRIVLFATPDPQPIALAALHVLAQHLPIQVVIYAPANEAENFDTWGRPRAEVWSRRELALRAFEEQVHLCADPAEQAARVSAAAGSYAQPDGVFALGLADTGLTAPVESALRDAHLPVFSPEGRARRGDALAQLLGALARLAREDSFTAVEALARCPEFLAFLRDRLGANFSAARFLSELDRLHTKHLPPTLTEALRHAQDNAALGLVAEIRRLLTREEFPANASEVMKMIFAARNYDLSRHDDLAAVEAAEAWAAVVDQITAARETFRNLDSGEWWDLALQLYGESISYEEKSLGAIELQGWLELLWEDAPHLVIAGFNDGAVPDAVVGDPFLPESLREQLGLKSNVARFARDAYILRALAESRAADGRLDLLVGKTSSTGDPLRPSRLLLQCADGVLPQRVNFLFGEVENERPSLPWQRAWKLKPPQVSPPARIAVTDFRRWLECPLRYYFSRVLKMEAVDPEKNELDIFDFGTLCHSALEAMGLEPALRDCTEPGPLREFLHVRLEQEATRRFGAERTLPLVVQLESARQRLAWAAEVQAKTRAEGWVIQHVEHPFEIEIDGLRVTGKIDRIDRHEASGAWRVLDYKTSDTAVSPEEAHLRGPRRTTETARDFARLVLNGREKVWTDLQLPLYRRAVSMLTAGAPLECGYFNLPKASSEVSIRGWEEFTRELEDAAWRCAEGVAAAIQAGEFWPPNEAIRPERDDFAALFHHGVAESVEWAAEMWHRLPAGEALRLEAAATKMRSDPADAGPRTLAEREPDSS